jgi:hypothetical protein
MKPRKPNPRSAPRSARQRKRLTASELKRTIAKFARDNPHLSRAEIALATADLLGIKVGVPADGEHLIIVVPPGGLPKTYTAAIVEQLRKTAPQVAARILNGTNSTHH